LVINTVLLRRLLVISALLLIRLLVISTMLLRRLLVITTLLLTQLRTIVNIRLLPVLRSLVSSLLSNVVATRVLLIVGSPVVAPAAIAVVIFGAIVVNPVGHGVDIIVGKIDGNGAFLIGAVAVIVVIFVVGTIVVIGAFHIGAVVIVVGAIVIIGAVLIGAVVIIVGVVIFVVIIVGIVVIIVVVRAMAVVVVGMRMRVIRALVGTITTIVVVVHNAFGSNKLVSIGKTGVILQCPLESVAT